MSYLILLSVSSMWVVRDGVFLFAFYPSSLAKLSLCGGKKKTQRKGFMEYEDECDRLILVFCEI